MLAKSFADGHALPGAGSDEEAGPNRRCIVTGEVLPTAMLVRFAIGPDGTVVPDIENRLPGRGLWLRARREVLDTALAKNAFARAARRPVIVPTDLAQQVDRLVARRCTELLAMARRAGQAVAGFEKVQGALGKGQDGLLLEASDGASDGRQKLSAAMPHGTVISALSADELGRAFGRERTVHAYLAPGGLAERLRSEMARLAGLRGVAPGV